MNFRKLSFHFIVGFIFSFLSIYYFAHINAINSEKVEIHTVELTATGEKGLANKGSEVWLYNINAEHWKISHDSGWEERDGVWVSYQNQPATLKIISNTAPILTFAKHPFSGYVEINSNNKSTLYNLYSSIQKFKDFRFNNHWNEINSFRLSMIFVAFSCLSFIISLYLNEKTYLISLFLIVNASVFIILIYSFYPGVYTNDSADQLAQAIANSYNDWHPPLMSYLWSILIDITGTDFSIYIAILVMMSVSMLIFSLLFNNAGYPIVSLLLPLTFLTPFIVNFIGVVWKDVLFASLILLSLSIIFAMEFSKNKFLTFFLAILAIILATISFGIRTNGIFVLAFTLLIIVSSCYKNIFSPFKIVSCSIIIFFISIFVNSQLKTIINSTSSFPIQYLQLFDLTGISVKSESELFPSYIKEKPKYAFKEISKTYLESFTTTGNANKLIFKENGSSAFLALTNNNSEISELQNAWLKAIINHPFEYFQHRLSVFSFFIFKGFYPYQNPLSDKERSELFSNFGVLSKIDEFQTVSRKTLQKLLLTPVKLLTDKNYMTGLIVIVANIFVFLLSFTLLFDKRLFRLVNYFSILSFVYIAPYIIVVPASDFRYLYWPCVSLTISLSIIILTLINKSFLTITSKRLKC